VTYRTKRGFSKIVDSIHSCQLIPNEKMWRLGPTVRKATSHWPHRYCRFPPIISLEIASAMFNILAVCARLRSKSRGWLNKACEISRRDCRNLFRPFVYTMENGDRFMCATNTKRKFCDAVSKMGVGLPKSACRSGLQTAAVLLR